MKIKHKKFLFLLLGGLVALASCTKKLNTNLNDPNGPPISQLTGKDVFAGALTEMVINKSGQNVSTASNNYDYANQWVQYYARSDGWSASGSQEYMETFQVPNSFGDGNWSSLYHNIYDLNFVISSSSANSILPGAARALRTMIFQDLVDQFGNIPYSQALQPPGILQPAYDSATVIYADLINQLDTALTVMAASQSTADDASDVMFQGNKLSWEQFANTIKLRLLLRQVPNGNQTYVTTQLAAIAQQGSGFLTQDCLVQPGFQDEATKQTPFWSVYGFAPSVKGVEGPGYEDNNFFAANQVFLNFLDSIGDPRPAYFFAPSSAGPILGEQFGNNNLNQTASTFGPGLLQGPTAPALLFSAAQSYFMQAEAVQRGLLNTGSVSALYQHGVEASFNYLGVTNAVAAADSYMSTSTNGMVNFSLSTNPLQTIMYQKWISECSLDGLEAYSDWRRTGFPFIAIPSYAVPGTAIPQRLLYPETEYTQNSNNVNAQNQTAADLYTPIFWAQ
jgi:hypothetical protein